MTTEEFMAASHDLSCVYQHDQIKGITERQFIGKKMHYSQSHVDRSRYANECNKNIRSLMLSGIISVSCSVYIKGKSEKEQQQIYNILMAAKQEGFALARDRVVIPITNAVKTNSNVTWDDIRPTIKPLKTHGKKEIAKKETPNSTANVGNRFTSQVVELINGKEFAFAMKNPKQTWDFKEDAFAVDHDGKLYAIQCKYHSYDEEDEVCVKEAKRGKINYNRDYAIGVTNTSFSDKAKKLAKALKVELWDGDYLREHFGWDGKI